MRVLALVACTVLAGCGERQPRQAEAAEPPVQFQRAASTDVAHGERLSRVLGCSGCHGEDLAGEDWSDELGVLWTSNLTRAVPNYSDAQLAGVIRTGTRPDGSELWGMPSFLFTQLTADDMAALIAFLRSRPATGEAHPRPSLTEPARRAIAAGELKSSAADVREMGEQWPPHPGDTHVLGRYLARATCAECHGLDLKGREPLGPGAPPPDLSIVSAYDRQQFEKLMRTGIAAGERELELMSGVARGRYRHFTQSELDALHAYLQAVGGQR